MFVGTWWSLMPPIIAILLALFTKEVYLSLFAGCALGALLVVGPQAPTAKPSGAGVGPA